MSDPVLGNAARWHSTSPLYGENVPLLLVPDATMWHWRWSGLGPIGGFLFSAVNVVVMHGDLDAPRHDL